MADPKVNPISAAILSADVVGYTRLMRAGATPEPYPALFQEHVAAVQAALDNQMGLGCRNETSPEAQRIRLRLSANLGDGVEKHDGSRVCATAPLEGLAEPAGNCLASSVREQGIRP